MILMVILTGANSTSLRNRLLEWCGFSYAAEITFNYFDLICILNIDLLGGGKDSRPLKT